MTSMPAPAPREFQTEPGALEDIAIPAVLRPMFNDGDTRPPAAALPAPRLQLATGTEARVCADIATRQALGLLKYGTTVEANPLQLRAWLQHAYEETLDLAIYLRRSIEQLDKDSAA